MKVIGLVSDCDECPNKRYYSGGRSECTKAQEIIPTREDRGYRPPAWCPLTDYPAGAMEELRRENKRLQAELAARQGVEA